MKIRARIYLSIGLICLTLMAALMAAYGQSSRVRFYLGQSDSAQAELLFVTDVRGIANARILEGYEEILGRDLGRVEPIVERPKNTSGNLMDLGSFLDTQTLASNKGAQAAHEEKMRLVAILQASYGQIDRMVGQALDLARSSRSRDAARLLGGVAREFDGTFRPTIRSLLSLEEESVRSSESGLKESVERLKHTLILLVVSALVIVIALGIPLARSIGSRLEELVQATDEIGRQNFGFRLRITGKDELSTLAHAFNSMGDLLVTAREELFEQQKHIVRTSKMSALGEMASGIAHEINNPVAIVLTRAEQLEEVLAEKELDRALLIELASAIRRTAGRIGKIVKGLKSFAREGEVDPFETVSLHSVIQDTLDLCRDRFRTHGIELRTGVLPVDMTISCRPVQVSQVLLNLVNNAFDAAQPSAGKWVALSFEEVGLNVEISVSDSGDPIPPEVKEKIMQPFFTTKEVGKGTGLGLSISKGLVESHGGELRLDEASSATRFIVRLPRFHASPPSV